MGDYNGWRNRETWLVNLHFGDYFTELANEGTRVTASFIEEMIEEHVNEHVSKDAMFIRDMMSMGAIDYDELADHYYDAMPEDNEETNEGDEDETHD